jgi:hypothetical protein
MTKGIIALALCAMFFGLCGSVDAQQTGKAARIGFLDPSTASGMAVLVDAFRQELSKLSWIEGKNIYIEYRFAEQKTELLPRSPWSPWPGWRVNFPRVCPSQNHCLQLKYPK